MDSEREPLLYNSKNKEIEEKVKKRNVLILGLGFFFGNTTFKFLKINEGRPLIRKKDMNNFFLCFNFLIIKLNKGIALITLE